MAESLENTVIHNIPISSVGELAKFQIDQLHHIKLNFDKRVHIKTTGILNCDFTELRGNMLFNQRLQDPTSNKYILINVDQSLVKNIQRGELVEITGFFIIYLDHKTKQFLLRINVTNVTRDIDSANQKTIAQTNLDLLSEIKNIQIKNHDFPIRKYGKKTNIALVHPKSDTTVKDFYEAIGNTENLDCVHFETNISSTNSLIETFSNIDKTKGFDIVAVIRGGGDGFDVFDDINVCKAFNDINSYKIIGLGHKEHITLLDLFADHVAATPSLLGIYVQSKIKRADQFRIVNWQNKQQRDKPTEAILPIVLPQEKENHAQIIKNHYIIMVMLSAIFILILLK